MARNVIAMYPDLQTAERVVQELLDSGVNRDQLSVVAHDASQKYRDLSTMSDRRRSENAARSAGGGAIAGAIGGALLAVGLAAIPGVGWIIGAGPVASILATGGIGAAVGAAAGGLGGALSKMGVPEGRAGEYAEAVRRGGALVAVEVEDRDAYRIANLMDRHHPVDMDRSAKRWREQEGWTSYDASAAPFGDEEVTEERRRWSEQRLSYGDAPRTHTAQPATQPEQPGGPRQQPASPRPAASATHPTVPGVAADASEQHPVRVGTYPAGSAVPSGIDEEGAKEPVQAGEEAYGGSTSFGTSLGPAAHRAHFDQHFPGQDWNAYRAAYRLGEELARQETPAVRSGRQRDWAQIEPEARRMWERQGHPSLSFERARGAIRHAFDEERRAGLAASS